MKAPDGREIGDVFRERFGDSMERGLRRLERLAGNAIFFDKEVRRRSGEEYADPIGVGVDMVSTVRLSDGDFALLAFFAGVGRMVVLGEVAPEALPPRRSDDDPA